MDETSLGPEISAAREGEPELVEKFLIQLFNPRLIEHAPLSTRLDYAKHVSEHRIESRPRIHTDRKRDGFVGAPNVSCISTPVFGLSGRESVFIANLENARKNKQNNGVSCAEVGVLGDIPTCAPRNTPQTPAPCLVRDSLIGQPVELRAWKTSDSKPRRQKPGGSTLERRREDLKKCGVI
ncbi:hypothetical protein RRG08_011456 [Elysia crispata]|uniref:Uncharacterized protein n=1 Tax=Elysia crispata TaxID=231223 RepID=A0AAE0ZV50_9GAST|nr:hypothetical protein RRG08_011456 [Elysia crispata]